MKQTAHEKAWGCMLELFLAQRPRFIAVAQEFGLHPLQGMAIKHLDPERGIPMSELAKALRCDNSNVTGIADRLEAAGLAERRASPTDRRVKTLVLTEHGAAVRAAYLARLSLVPPELENLSEAEAEQLLALMRRAAGAGAAPAPRTSPTA